MTNDAISRRGFVGLGLMMGAGTIGAGLAGCAPSTGSTSAATEYFPILHPNYCTIL